MLTDITNRCNAKCAWWPNPDLSNLGAMDMGLYRKIIDDYGTHGGVVTFGEPLMDKHMRERIEYLSWHNLNDYYDGDGKFLPQRRFIMG